MISIRKNNVVEIGSVNYEKTRNAEECYSKWF